MVYKDFQGIRLSQLGMGCMRLPVINGKDDEIDEEKTFVMIDHALSQGINYIDTAWGYHGGNTETVVGKALQKYDRNSYYLATKFPGYDLANFGKEEEIFEKQLEKLQTDYIDFYLLHNVCEMNIDSYLDAPKYHTLDYFRRQKEAGRIRHLGFSVHGSFEVMKKFLDAYGEFMEFCQIQLNYVDWHFQKAQEKVNLLKEMNIPIWVMEPLRGGMLVKLPEEEEHALQEIRPNASMIDWAFRFLQSIPEVTVILSGMSSFDQLDQNIRLFEEDNPLSSFEQMMITRTGDRMSSKDGIPCTSCHYCASHCPQEIDIPYMISLYNEHAYTGGGFIAPMALMAVPDGKKPQDCLQCRSCEEVCPQQIKISEVLADFVAKMQPSA